MSLTSLLTWIRDRLFPRQESPFSPQSLLRSFFIHPLTTFIYSTHQFLGLLRWHPRPLHPIRLVCISDTHTLIPRDIPDGDVLIHAGDLTNDGTPSELQAQLKYLSSLPHKHKLLIAGNHDYHLDSRSRKIMPNAEPDVPLPDFQSYGITYLQHSSKTFTFPSRTSPHRRRVLKFYGAPHTPACGPSYHAFQYPPHLDSWSHTIPIDADVVITHTPAQWHRDNGTMGLGDGFLLQELNRVKPRAHIHGHVHAGAGREFLWWDGAQKAYERALRRSRGKWMWFDVIDARLWGDLARMVAWTMIGLAWSRIWGGEEPGTLVVNAALMIEGEGKLRDGAQVVDI